MEKKIIICDKSWYEKNYPLQDVEFDEIIKINYKEDFSYIILNELYQRHNDAICIVGAGCDNIQDKIDKIIKFTYNNHNYATLYSNNIDDFDFSQFSRSNTIICIPSNAIKKQSENRKFSTILNLQKYIISSIINTNKIYLYILNSKNNFKKVETNEDKLIKKARHKRPPMKISKKYDSSPVKKLNEKPKVIFVCDVKGWAWWIKSQYIKKYLSPYYDIDIISVVDGNKKIDFKKYDIYFTYGYSYVSRIQRANDNRKIAGVTAHRPMDVLKPKLNQVKWVHANSLLLYNEIAEVFKNPFYVPNGVDEQLFYPQKDILQNGDITFGHVGKLSPKKGQREFIEPAINKAKAKYYSHYNNYKNKVEHKDMPKIHHQYDVFLCASEEDGTPCPALEAAACGRPIISNKIGNMPELVENYKTGILLDNKNVDDYVDAIKWCKDNPEKVKQMGMEMRKKIETEWTWNLMARNYLYMFDKILGINRDLSYYENPALYHGI